MASAVFGPLIIYDGWTKVKELWTFRAFGIDFIFRALEKDDHNG